MADYEYKFRLQSAPTPSTDGSGVVYHDVYAICREEGSQDEWTIVPGRHKTIPVPAQDLLDVLAGTSVGTNYKELLRENLHAVPKPITGWGLEDLEALMDANDLASEAAQGAEDYVTVTLGRQFPLDFSL